MNYNQRRTTCDRNHDAPNHRRPTCRNAFWCETEQANNDHTTGNSQVSRNQTLALTQTLTDPMWRELRQGPPNSSFNTLHDHVPKHLVRERLWSGWWVTLWNWCPICSNSANRLHVCAQKSCWTATYETPGMTPGATVRTANWLRHLPAHHRHIDDRCSDSGEPLERRRQLTIPHHSQPELSFRRLTRPFINNTRIDTPIATMTSHGHLTGTPSADRVVS